MESVERKVYFDDVKLQMDAKLWSKLATLNCYLILNTYITLQVRSTTGTLRRSQSTSFRCQSWSFPIAMVHPSFT